MISIIPLIFLLIPVSFLLLFNPRRMSRLGPNAYIGLRTPLTTQSQENWSLAHRTAWPYVASSSVLLVILLPALAYWSFSESGETTELISGLGTAGAVVIWLVILLVGSGAAHSKIREHEAREGTART